MIRNGKNKLCAKAVSAALALLALLFAVFPACSIKTASETAPRRPTIRGTEIIDDEPSRHVIRHSLVIISKHVDENGCSLLYPYVCNNGMTLLNINIRAAFTEFADECEAAEGEISYVTEFNRFGLLSIMMTYSVSGRTICFDTANFDADTGKRVRLSDCFGSTSADYRAKLAEIVLRTADSEGYTLIAEQPPVNDDTMFVFTFGGLYLVYPEYELFTHEAGAPRIKIGCRAMTNYTSPDGLMNRLR
ncbi:MAG: DUF3298 domain-containing protein [Clostridia bacterium]|nr:DUF3298 domain-containing protein [Clostridia bacterium]